MSRGHVQGFDSNAAQFARLGNPWDGEPLLTRKAKRKLRKGLRPCRPGLPRRLERSSRDECEAVRDLQCKRRIHALVAAEYGNGRAVALSKSPTLAIFNRIEHPARTELTRWQQFERQVTRCKQRGDTLRRLAEGQEKMRIADERARLKAQLKAIEARLASLARFSM